VSVHGEAFSPFSQLCEAVGTGEALVALRADPAGEGLPRGPRRGTVASWPGTSRPGPTPSSSRAPTRAAAHLRPRLPRFRSALRGEGRRRLQARCPGRRLHAHLRRIGDRLELLERRARTVSTPSTRRARNVDLTEAKRRVGERLFLKGTSTRGNGAPRNAGGGARRRRPPHRDRRAGRRLRSLHRLLGAPGGAPGNVRQLRAAALAPGLRPRQLPAGRPPSRAGG